MIRTPPEARETLAHRRPSVASEWNPLQVHHYHCAMIITIIILIILIILAHSNTNEWAQLADPVPAWPSLWERPDLSTSRA